jgi:anti-sigma B factor antagonist
MPMLDAKASDPMTHDELSIDLKTEDGGALVFKLRGSLDIATAPTVRAALSESADKGGNHVIVDLSQLEFLDSTGLGVLIGAHRRAAEHGGSFRLIVTDGPILRLLNITGLVSVFSVYQSLDDARRDRARMNAAL